MQLPSGFVTLRSFLIGSLLLVHFSVASAQGLFSISVPRLCTYVGPGPAFNVTNELTSPVARSGLRRHEIWLLLSIIGDANTLKYLQDNEYLSLTADIWADGTKWGSVEIGMHYDDWERNGDALVSELQDKGVFLWRTRLRTTKIDAGKIEVKFFDQRGDTISPVNYSGAYETTVIFK